MDAACVGDPSMPVVGNRAETLFCRLTRTTAEQDAEREFTGKSL
ncbi:hypothetical protein [Saccharothrix sp. Mg75]